MEQQTIEEFNRESRLERRQQVTQIENDLTFTTEAFQLLSEHVANQSSAIDSSESNLETVNDNLELAAVNLCQVEKRVINWRWLKAGVIGLGVAVVVATATVIGVKASNHNP